MYGYTAPVIRVPSPSRLASKEQFDRTVYGTVTPRIRPSSDSHIRPYDGREWSQDDSARHFRSFPLPEQDLPLIAPPSSPPKTHRLPKAIGQRHKHASPQKDHCARSIYHASLTGTAPHKPHKSGLGARPEHTFNDLRQHSGPPGHWPTVSILTPIASVASIAVSPQRYLTQAWYAKMS